jgi:hypothetical protein
VSWEEASRARDALTWLQDWHAAQLRDGRSAGRVRIATLDNPGWEVSIDLDTDLASRDFTEINDHPPTRLDWFEAKVSRNVYRANSGPLGLGRCLEEFRHWVQQHEG